MTTNAHEDHAMPKCHHNLCRAYRAATDDDSCVISWNNLPGAGDGDSPIYGSLPTVRSASSPAHPHAPGNLSPSSRCDNRARLQALESDQSEEGIVPQQGRSVQQLEDSALIATYAMFGLVIVAAVALIWGIVS